MNKFSFLLIPLASAVLFLSGCSTSGTDDNPSTGAVPENGSESTDNPGIKIVEINCDSSSICGSVFYDIDKDSVYRTNDSAIPGIQVSDGRNIAVTDKTGFFKLPKDAEFVYITKPSGYDLPNSTNNIPLFFKKTTTGKNIYNFSLTPSENKGSFSAIIMNDIHLEVVADEGDHNANQEPLKTFTEYIDEFASLDPKPDFYIAVGDQSGVTPDNTKGLDDYVSASSRIGAPFYNAMGNPGHNDSDLDRVFFKEAYRSYFGPLYYAFEYGDYHFVILDTNLISGEHGRTLQYGIDENQMAWFKADLELNKNKKILIFFHEPIDNTENQIEYIAKIIIGSDPDVWIGKQEILNLIKTYHAAAVFAGHTHSNGLYEENGTVFVTNGAVSGAWWGPDFNSIMELLYPDVKGTGINSNPDGTPQGYRILTGGPAIMSTSYKTFHEERNVCFADPAGTIIGSGKLSYFDIDATNAYTFCLQGEPGSLISGASGLKSFEGVIPLTLNAYSLYPVRKVEYKIGSGDWIEAVHSGGLVWKSQIDASKLKSGIYRLSARVVDDKGERISHMNIIVGF